MPIDVLRQLAATLAYRAAKVLRDATPGFASTFAPSTRQPMHLVAHTSNLIVWGVTLARVLQHVVQLAAVVGARTVILV